VTEFQNLLIRYNELLFTLVNSGFYFHPSTAAYPRFSKSGAKGERITKAKLKTAMETNPSIVTDNFEIVEDFFKFNRDELSDLVTPEKIISKIVEEKFDQIIRTP